MWEDWCRHPSMPRAFLSSGLSHNPLSDCHNPLGPLQQPMAFLSLAGFVSCATELLMPPGSPTLSCCSSCSAAFPWQPRIPSGPSPSATRCPQRWRGLGWVEETAGHSQLPRKQGFTCQMLFLGWDPNPASGRAVHSGRRGWICFPFRVQLGQGFTALCLSLLLGEKIHLTGCAKLFCFEIVVAYWGKSHHVRHQTGALVCAVPSNAAGMQLWKPQLLSFKVPVDLQGLGDLTWDSFPRALGVFGDQMLSGESGGTHLERESFVPASGWIMHWRKSAKLGKVQESS